MLACLSAASQRLSVWVAITIFSLLCSMHAVSADTVKVGVYHNPPKIFADETGHLSGLLGELLVAIAAQEDWQLQPVPCDWNQCLQMLEQGQLDLMPDVAFSQARQERFAFHQTPALLSWSQLYRLPETAIDSVLDLHHKKIAVLRGSIQQEFLVNLGQEFAIQLQLIPVANFNDGFQLAAQGLVEAVVSNHLYGEYHAPGWGLVRTPIIFQPARLFYAAPKSAKGQALLQQIDAQLLRWRDVPDSPYQLILQKWSSPQVAWRTPPNIKWWLGALLLALLAVSLGLLYSRRRLRIQHQSLEQTQHRLDLILDSLDAYVYVKDKHYRYQYISPQVCTLLGLAEADILGKTDAQLLQADSAARLAEHDRLVMKNGERLIQEESWQPLAQQPARVFLSIKTPLFDQDGQPCGLGGVSTDISERRHNQELIDYLANYDSLTTLPNRKHCLNLLQQLLSRRQTTPLLGALIMVDVDHLRQINDSYGLTAGDCLLADLAQRLLPLVPEGSLLARSGGDEFTLILDQLPQHNLYHLEHFANQIRAVARPSFNLSEQANAIEVSLSLGITTFSDSRYDAEALLQQAEQALYQAKAVGAGHQCFYDQSLQQQIVRRLQLQQAIHAQADSEFLLYYQPQLNRNNHVVGVEALVRWQPPGQPLRSPADFIPLAEASELIIPLGDIILRQACQQLATWAQQPHTAHLYIAVNISAKQLHEEHFVARLHQALNDSGARPSQLKLEITESLLITQPQQVSRTIKALQKIGIGFALDDFGTGYSSLSYLKELPLDQLKIDQSFIQDLLTNPHSTTIVNTILALGRSMEIAVIAEGVETPAQHKALLMAGCQYFQGFLFSRPLPIEQLQSLLTAELPLYCPPLPGDQPRC